MLALVHTERTDIAPKMLTLQKNSHWVGAPQLSIAPSHLDKITVTRWMDRGDAERLLSVTIPVSMPVSTGWLTLPTP